MGDTSRRVGMTREHIVQEALAIVRADGLGGLTMRKLADRLNVWPRTIYHHAGSSRSDILDLVVEAVLMSVARPSTDLPWDEQIRTISRELRSAFHDHPGIAERMLADGPPLTPQALWIPDAVQHLLISAGLNDHDAVHAWLLLSSHICQQVIIETRWSSSANGFGEMTPDEWSAYIEQVQAATADLPTLQRTMSGVTDGSHDDAFEFGIDVVLAGLTQRIGNTP